MNETIPEKIKQTKNSITELFRREFEPNIPDRLGPAKGSILGFVECHPGATANDVAQRFRLQKSTVSELLKDLIERGYLEAKPSQEDGRKKILVLTEKAAEHHKTIEPVFRAFDERVESTLTKEEKEQLMTLLDKVIQGIGGE